ncbi:40604_t:CDS:1, partial [Gigaspora margarita]
YYILECPNVRLLNEKYTMLTRTLTPEQGKKLQELINKNIGDPLNDKQIPAALNLYWKY